MTPWLLPSKLTSELPGQSGPHSAHLLRAESCHKQSLGIAFSWLSGAGSSGAGAIPLDGPRPLRPAAFRRACEVLYVQRRYRVVWMLKIRPEVVRPQEFRLML
jgi:hypothetical protein